MSANKRYRPIQPGDKTRIRPLPPTVVTVPTSSKRKANAARVLQQSRPPAKAVPAHRKIAMDASGVPAAARAHRPDRRLLTTAAFRTTKLDLPAGCFNAGLVAVPDSDRYICAYRPDEHAFVACTLRPDFAIEKGSQTPLGISNCADPRLIWLPDGRLLLVYSSTEETGRHQECIRGMIIMQSAASPVSPQPAFRISPPSERREKNWVPFLHDDRLYLIASTKPHVVYEVKTLGEPAEKAYETDFVSPWFSGEFKRGNTPPIRLDDGNFLGTFHTVQKHEKLHLYDNGCYVFEGKPPFRVLRCGHRTILAAEHADEKHFRKAGLIQVCFPVGMVRDGRRLIVSYGDNDSAVKIMETTVDEMLRTTMPVY